jgi:dTDP-4-dehydrorhamnose reductase
MERHDRYLVTGGNGQVAQAVQNRLFTLPGSQVKPREMVDITSKKSVERCVDSIKPDAVINCAGYSDFWQADSERSAVFNSNVKGVSVLAAALAKRGIPLVHVSSNFVFGSHAGPLPLKEEDNAFPLSYFGLSKLSGEHAIAQQKFEYPDWKCFIVRTSYVFGSNTPSPRDFLHQTLEHLQEKRRVYLPSDIYTSITFADDLAASLLYVASHTKEVASGIYHVANSGMTSLYQAAAELLQYFPRRGRNLKTTSLEGYEKAKGCRGRMLPRYSALCTDKFFKLPESPVLVDWQTAIGRWMESRVV